MHTILHFGKKFGVDLYGGMFTSVLIGSIPSAIIARHYPVGLWFILLVNALFVYIIWVVLHLIIFLVACVTYIVKLKRFADKLGFSFADMEKAAWYYDLLPRNPWTFFTWSRARLDEAMRLEKLLHGCVE